MSKPVSPLSLSLSLCLGLALFPSATHAQAAGGDLIGQPQTYVAQKGDSLSVVARRFDIGAVELEAANPQVKWPKLREGDTLTVPTQHIAPEVARQGIVVNLAEMRLFLYGPDGRIDTFPISVGREGKHTPTGTTRIVQKRKDPTWVVPPSIRAEDPKLPAVVPPGPKNPLGRYALNLGWPGYAIHGTNAPSSIGKPVSHGCMRMYPEDIERLFAAVDVGTPVTVIDTPVKLGSDGKDLYLEVTPSQAQAASVVRYRKAPPLPDGDPNIASLRTALSEMEGKGEPIDHEAIDAALNRHDGIPVVVTKHQP